MIHSYSSINTWLNCPRQFEAVYLERRVKSFSDEITYGERVHSEIESYLKGSDALPRETPQNGLLHLLRGLGAEPEVSLAVTADLEPASFFGEGARLRGKLDAVLVDPQLGVIAWDWKTGKRRENSLQAAVYSTMLQAHYPGERVRVVFDYLSKGSDPPIEGVPEDRRRVVSLMDDIDVAKVFPPRPSGLCPWCPVTDCEYWRER